MRFYAVISCTKYDFDKNVYPGTSKPARYTLTQFLKMIELSDVPESITIPGLSNNLTCLSN